MIQRGDTVYVAPCRKPIHEDSFVHYYTLENYEIRTRFRCLLGTTRICDSAFLKDDAEYTKSWENIRKPKGIPLDFSKKKAENITVREGRAPIGNKVPDITINQYAWDGQ